MCDVLTAEERAAIAAAIDAGVVQIIPARTVHPYARDFAEFGATQEPAGSWREQMKAQAEAAAKRRDEARREAAKREQARAAARNHRIAELARTMTVAQISDETGLSERRVRHGLTVMGVSPVPGRPCPTQIAADARRIRQMREEGMSRRAIAAAMGLHPSRITRRMQSAGIE